MTTARKFLTAIMNVLTGASFLAMLILVTWQVFTRYVLKAPSIWSEELVSYLFGWASLLGACLVTSEHGHMNIPIIVERFPMKLRIIFAIGAELIALIFSLVILLFGGVQITGLSMGQLTTSLTVPVGYFYIILPLAGFINALYALLNIIDILRYGVHESTEETSSALEEKEE